MIKNGTRVQIALDQSLLSDDEDEILYMGWKGHVEDEDADDPDYEGFLKVRFDSGTQYCFPRSAIINLTEETHHD